MRTPSQYLDRFAKYSNAWSTTFTNHVSFLITLFNFWFTCFFLVFLHVQIGELTSSAPCSVNSRATKLHNQRVFFSMLEEQVCYYFQICHILLFSVEKVLRWNDVCASKIILTFFFVWIRDHLSLSSNYINVHTIGISLYTVAIIIKFWERSCHFVKILA